MQYIPSSVFFLSRKPGQLCRFGFVLFGSCFVVVWVVVGFVWCLFCLRFFVGSVLFSQYRAKKLSRNKETGN